MNVKALNYTRDLYSSFDCPEACEFLYSCIRDTIEKDLPDELHYLKCHDQAMAGINRIVDIPDNMAKSLVIFVWQNNVVLPKKRRLKEFAALTDTEVAKIERAVKEAFSTPDLTQEVSAADI